jgi:hypothetical protein
MRSILVLISCVCALLALSMAGCTGKSTPTAAPAAHSHVHGPHEGELIELGHEEYHAELFDDDDQKVVTIYILDKEAKQPVPIAEDAITIHMQPGANIVEFRLPAKPQESDPAGKSSRFESAEWPTRRLIGSCT